LKLDPSVLPPKNKQLQSSIGFPPVEIHAGCVCYDK
jgi:hypothetical protein